MSGKFFSSVTNEPSYHVHIFKAVMKNKVLLSPLFSETGY